MTVLLLLSDSAQEAAGTILHGPGCGDFVSESAARETIAVIPDDVIKTGQKRYRATPGQRLRDRDQLGDDRALHSH